MRKVMRREAFTKYALLSIHRFAVALRFTFHAEEFYLPIINVAALIVKGATLRGSIRHFFALGHR